MDSTHSHHHLFAESHMNPYDYEKQGRALEKALDETGRPDAGLVAVSELRSGALLLVLQTWHMVAEEKGMFSKRVEILERVGYQDVTMLHKHQAGVRGRDGMTIEGSGQDNERLFELGWGYSGSGTDEYGVAERDRVFDLISICVERVSPRWAKLNAKLSS